jgi:hypothetical protein
MVVEPEEKRPLARLLCKSGNNIKMDLIELEVVVD